MPILNLVAESDNFEKMNELRHALLNKFPSYWVCLHKMCGNTKFGITITNNWDGPLTKDESGSVTEFITRFMFPPPPPILAVFSGPNIKPQRKTKTVDDLVGSIDTKEPKKRKPKTQ